jgi:hypothetical protein
VPTTVDEMYEVLKAFRDNDANGNGDPALDRPGFTLNVEEQEATDPLTEINTAVSEVYMNVIIGNRPP